MPAKLEVGHELTAAAQKATVFLADKSRANALLFHRDLLTRGSLDLWPAGFAAGAWQSRFGDARAKEPYTDEPEIALQFDERRRLRMVAILWIAWKPGRGRGFRQTQCEYMRQSVPNRLATPINTAVDNHLQRREVKAVAGIVDLRAVRECRAITSISARKPRPSGAPSAIAGKLTAIVFAAPAANARQSPFPTLGQDS